MMNPGIDTVGSVSKELAGAEQQHVIADYNCGSEMWDEPVN